MEEKIEESDVVATNKNDEEIENSDSCLHLNTQDITGILSQAPAQIVKANVEAFQRKEMSANSNKQIQISDVTQAL